MSRILGIILLALLGVGWSTLAYSQATVVDPATDSLSVQAEDITNPFDVNHIPIRKNQANVNTENLSFSGQVERHFALIVIIGLLTLLSVIALRQRDLLGAIIRSLVREYALVDFWRTESRGLSVSILASYFFGLASFAFFLTLAIDLSPDQTYWRTYGLILLGLLGYFALKHLALNILSRVYSVSSQVEFYNSLIVTINIFTGGILFFLAIFMSFGPDIIQPSLKTIGWFVVIFGFIYQIGRAALHVISAIIRYPFPYFVYLCALEISPFLIIWRYLTS